MVISRKYKYCFIEYPRSASYAIRKDLMQFYGGEDWLEKHSSYHAFVKSLPEEHQDYFVFASIRNPLEDIVSIYNVYRTNASGRATPEFWKNYKWYIRWYEMRRAKFFSGDGDKSFQEFFKHYFRLPYVKPRIVAEFSDAKIDHIIRVENLQHDFAAVLKKMNIPQVRPIEIVNRSSEDHIDLDKYYTEDIRQRAVRVVGPMMKFMGYNFPQHWKAMEVPRASRVYFAAVKPLASYFWNNVEYRRPKARPVGLA